MKTHTFTHVRTHTYTHAICYSLGSYRRAGGSGRRVDSICTHIYTYTNTHTHTHTQSATHSAVLEERKAQGVE